MSTQEGPAALGHHDDDRHIPHVKPIRFKQTTSHRSQQHPDDSFRVKRRYHRRHHHRQHGKHKHGESSRLSPPSSPPVAPDVAFRESLFDALADDEGAAFWEGVYGQPVHSYPNVRTNDATGELEQMTDEEYAAYVRRRMWEKSYEGIEAEREERRRKKREEDQARNKERKERSNVNAHGENSFSTEIEESLRRGEERKRRKFWKERWQKYQQAWTDLDVLVSSCKAEESALLQINLRDKIPWPAENGKLGNVDPEEIEIFIRHGPTAKNDNDSRSGQWNTMMEVLKLERIRWHPDKMHQRYGTLKVDHDTRNRITAVFQVLDRMWNNEKSKMEGT
ncbi:MAG: hypothetical protein Q9227_003120 [Pyrenula ochraceoflavens]